MSQDESSSKDKDDEQEMVMPGFRFRPTEEELVEFYLRRKVEGKHFNVELITFLHLYRYDPWELPALAAIGEKEWYFYVPRDRKYRNGDRPNRVTTSGYWKATGADRMIRGESFRAIGLKKTMVFYFGKAPKGIRTSWIMNEYRLPHHETQSLQKAEISLCRVHKRVGVEDHPSLPRSLPTRASSSRGIQSDRKQQDASQHGIDRFQAFGGQAKQVETEKISEASGSSSTEVGTAFVLPGHGSHIGLAPMAATNNISLPPSTLEEDLVLLHRARQSNSIPHNSTSTVLTASSFVSPNGDDDLQRLVNYQQISITHQQQCHNNYHSHPSHVSNLQPLPHPRLLAPNGLIGSLQAAFPDKLWEWNSITEASKDYIGSFK